MRTRYLVSILVIVPVSLLFLLRHHIRDLSEVARTYSTFHSYLRRHEDALLRYPSALSQKADSVVQSKEVPKIIHQIFLTDGRPNSSLSKYESAINSCKELHPDWKAYMWTDEEARRFIAEFYPAILPHYVGYKQNIQRANILRYALLHHFGGVYVDLDVTCLSALDAPLSKDDARSSLTHLPWLTPGAYPAGVNNAFILSRPGHPFLARLLERVPSRDLMWPMPYVENMLSTGCMYFSNVWTSYMLEAETRNVAMEDRVYVLANDDGDMESHMLRGKVVTPLFEHGGASSWHGWDAQMIVLIGKHYGYFALMLGFGTSVAVFTVWRCTQRSTSGRRSSWGRFARQSLDGWGSDKAHLLADEEKAL